MLEARDIRKTPKIGWPVLDACVLTGLLILGIVSVDLTLPAYGMIASDLGGDPKDWQYSFASFFLGFALAQLVFGLSADFLGRNGAVLAALVLFSTGSLLCASAGTISELTAYRFVQALGAGAGPLLARIMLRDGRSASTAAHALSTYGGVVAVLPVVAPFVGTVIVASLGWRSLFVQQAVFGVGLALLFALRLQDRNASQRGRQARTGDSVVRPRPFVDQRFLKDALSLSLIYAGLMVFVTSSPAVLMGQFKIAPKVFSLLFAAVWLVIVAGMFWNRRIVRTISLRKIVLLATAAATVTCGSFLSTVIMTDVTAFSFVLVSACYAFCAGIVTPNGLILVMGDDRRYFAGRAAGAGIIQYTVAAAAIYLSGFLTPSAVVVLLLLFGLAGGALATQWRSGRDPEGPM